MAGRMLVPFICGCIASVSLPGPTRALDALRIGKDSEIAWDGSGAAVRSIDPEYRALDPDKILIGNTPGGLIDQDHADYPGSLVPRQFRQENIAPGTIARGGSIRAPTVLDFTDDFRIGDLEAALEELLTDESGGELLAFERKHVNSLGTLIMIDLGARLGVSRIRFYPRNTVHPSPLTPFAFDYLRAYELLVNDGLNLTRSGNPIWEPLAAEKDNRDAVVDVVLDPPAYLRSIRLRSATPVDFEIDEIEVYATGFLPNARYVSDIYDLGLAAWGNIRWSERAVGDPSSSHLLISTRTGNDQTPFVYTRKLANKRDAEEIPTSLDDPLQPLGQEEYEHLPTTDRAGLQWTRGAVRDDLENWSPWSPPYTPKAGARAGTPILSPGPRRYIQFRAQFHSDDLNAARVLDRVSLDYLSPPLADQFVAEIFPRQVDVSTLTSFTYAVRPVMETPELLGFDSFEISTPFRVQGVDRIQILDPGGAVLAEHTLADMDTLSEGPFRITSVTDSRFKVRFPRIQDERLLKITFRAAVLVYGTNFNGWASLSTAPGTFQKAVPGNAAVLGDDDDSARSGIAVFSPSILKGQLIDAFEAAPNPFTPNQDGRNDRVSVAYNVLALTKAGRVTIQVHDLAGGVVRTLHDGPLASGRYVSEWDGLDANEKRVPPGIYLLRVSVEGDSRSEAQVRPVGVVY